MVFFVSNILIQNNKGLIRNLFFKTHMFNVFQILYKDDEHSDYYFRNDYFNFHLWISEIGKNLHSVKIK